MELADIGLIGLAVMGENLVLNMESKGFSVAVFNRTISKIGSSRESVGLTREDLKQIGTPMRPFRPSRALWRYDSQYRRRTHVPGEARRRY